MNAETTCNGRVLIVDDLQPNVRLLERLLRAGGYDAIQPCLDSRQALQNLVEFRPDLVLLDLHMPHLDGFDVLNRIQSNTPHNEFLPVLVLTADSSSAARDRALKAGAHDFLTKPFDSTEVLLRVGNLLRTRALQRSVTQLLERTLTGAVEALLEILSFSNPIAFARASRIATIVTELLSAVEPADPWSIRVAAGLSQVGAVTLDPGVARKLNEGKPLAKPEQEQVDRLPSIACSLLARIPQLEAVSDTIRDQAEPFADCQPGDARVGAHILRFAIDLDQLEARGMSRLESISLMRSRTGLYDPDLLDIAEFRAIGAHAAPDSVIIESSLAELVPGMVLAKDLLAENGVLLMGRGQEISDRTLELLRNFRERLTGPIYVSNGFCESVSDHLS